MAEEVTLTLPRERDFFGVAHLVLGGLAVRLNLTYEELEDLELAVDGLLAGDESGDGDVTVAVRVNEGALHATVGPFDAETLRRQLEPGGDEFGLRRVLDAVVDAVEVGEREGAQWVELRKKLHPPPAESEQ